MDKQLRRGGRGSRRWIAGGLAFAFTAALVSLARAQPARPQASGAQVLATSASPAEALTFEKAVQPVLTSTCVRCHNERLMTAGLNLSRLLSPDSLVSERDLWEKALDRVRAGEMPPKDANILEPAEVAGFVAYVDQAFDHADRNMKPDPGHVPIHRLNRVEYANTIRDLLGVDFRATQEFPADDSGYGFDNIGDVLTVSPLLMQKYMSAAEWIAARVVGADPLPSPGIFTRRDRVRTLTDSLIELRDLVTYDADYVIRVNVTGHRGDTDLPVTLVISADGTPVKTVNVPVQITAVNKQGGATQRVVEEARVFLAGGKEHVFRAQFVNDVGLATVPPESRRDAGKNIYPEFIEIIGPFAPPAPAPVVRRAAFDCVLAPADSGDACAVRTLTQLTKRAFRRAVTPVEVNRFVGVFRRARTAGYAPNESLQFAIAAVLVAPEFLFRIEQDPGPGRIARVTDYELASRLSYFLWSSMPDEELFKLAESKELHRPEVLEAEVRRMIADPRSTALAENFAGQWLETRSLDAVAPDRTKFPTWSNGLRDAMRTETRMFFEAVLREDRPISDFINGNFTFLNGPLARHYGISGVDGPEFRRVELTTPERSGVLTQGSVLTVSSYPTRTSVVIRGKYLLENVLNAPPPPPPPDVPALDDTPIGTSRSLREQMERHRADSLCASCHTKMDPLGFALENYDAVGRWRTEDGKLSLDVSGQLPNGRKFTGPAELKVLLLERMPAFTRSLSEKMLTYAIGRGIEPYDRLVIRKLVQDTTADGYRLQALVQGIVGSVPFQQRRGGVSGTPPIRKAEARP